MTRQFRGTAQITPCCQGEFVQSRALPKATMGCKGTCFLLITLILPSCHLVQKATSYHLLTRW